MLPKQFGILGHKVKDRLLGSEGVASSVHFDLYGCSRVTVSMLDKDQTPGGWIIDYSRLEILPGDPVMEVPKFAESDEMPVQLLMLGLKAKDIVTEKKGYISSVEFTITGVVFATVTPKKGDQKTFCLDFHRLRVDPRNRVMDAPDYSKDYQAGPDVSSVPRGCVSEEVERI